MSDVELIKICLQNAPCGVNKKQADKLLSAIVTQTTHTNSSEKHWQRITFDYGHH
jgi:hypothetical protein|tara:strand:+ start:623 stop:787 length:165 start_codon:yes stop_codon:yes gene_type:complete